jgi:hypothetical protein
MIKPVDVQAIAEEFPNSRFKITNVPILKPGVCFICRDSGGSDFRQFVDFGKTVDFYGVVYACTFCIAEVAQLLGLGDNSELTAELSRYEKAVQDFGTVNAGLQEQLNAARILLRNCTCCDDDSLNPRANSDVEADSDSVEADSDADESSDVEGSDDISANAGDDEPIAPKRRRTTKSAE